jgi:hypothetical protein
MEAGAFYIMDRGYRDFARLYALDQAGASSSRAPSATSMLDACTRREWIVSFAPVQSWNLRLFQCVPTEVPNAIANE